MIMKFEEMLQKEKELNEELHAEINNIIAKLERYYKELSQKVEGK